MGWFFSWGLSMDVSGQSGNPDDRKAQEFIAAFETQVVPIEIRAGRAWWNANTTGRDEDYSEKEQAENQLNAALADTQKFAALTEIRRAGVRDPILHRQIELLYLRFLEKQLETDLLQRMTAKSNAIERTFNVFRAQVAGQELTDSQVRRILQESKDSQEVQAVWEASKRVGQQVESDIRALVQLRNHAARELGFANFHEMQLRLQEQTPQQIVELFDQLDELTREPYRQIKTDIDRALAAKFSIPISELRPWHYQDPFFQESPDIFGVNVDAMFAEIDIPKVCGRFYAGIGLPIDAVLAQSDLYEKPGKSPHAFCTDIDRAGDVRVLCNIVPNEYWMATTLHELGHSVYTSRYIPPELPYLVRTNAHILTTEGLAMMFERFAGSSRWLVQFGVPVSEPEKYDSISQQKRRNRLLIFSRWCQVMLRFELGMYQNPDQDLNQLWWDLVERYQMIQRPDGRNAPDYASKIHVVSAPVYYHNYMLGELFACQLHARICQDVLGGADPKTAVYFDRPEVGQFLQERVFSQGALRPWNDLTRFATGSELKADAFAREFSR